MNIVLLDDVRSHNQILKTAVNNVLRKNGLPGKIVLEATDFEQVLDYASKDPPLTLYFLDIRLEQAQNGLDVLRQVRRTGIRDRFIIVTAYPHYALDCLKAHAYDLLIKPVEEAALEECLRSLYQELQADDGTMIDIEIGPRTVRLPIHEIWYIETSGRSLCAHTGRGLFTWAGSLSAMEEKLAPYSFIRIHRKCLVNSTHIQEWNSTMGEILVHGERLHVSRRMQSNLSSGGKKAP